MAFNTRVDAYIDWIDMVLSGGAEVPNGGTDKPHAGRCPGIDLQQLKQQLKQLVRQLQPILAVIKHRFEQVQAFRQGRSGGLKSLGQKFGWGKRKGTGGRNRR
jgi:hypothetical protein